MRNAAFWGAIASVAVACAATAHSLARESTGTAGERGIPVRPFPRPALVGAYGMSALDEFHYAAPYAGAAVRYAAYRVLEQYGPTANPMEICDISTAEGRTPPGRHPGAAHDGGVNFDITYYMTRDVASRIVCPQNADDHCTGPAVDLDTRRQAAFFAVLSELDLTFHRRLIDKMAVDGKVRQAVLPALDRLAATGEFPSGVVNHAKELVYGETYDQRTGWFRYHHNHTHVRFRWNAEEASSMAASIESGVDKVVARASGAGGVVRTSRRSEVR